MNTETPALDYHSLVDHFERAIAEKTAPTEMPVHHFFVPGFYIRQIFMPKGTLCTSKIHRKANPYIITKGKVSVLTADGGVTLEAPFSGVTTPGTRRMLYIHEDCVWTTFHATDKTDLREIEGELIEPHENPLVEPFSNRLITASGESQGAISEGDK